MRSLLSDLYQHAVCGAEVRQPFFNAIEVGALAALQMFFDLDGEVQRHGVPS
jgi:hypothetical protein